jgi:hypothetical protein
MPAYTVTPAAYARAWYEEKIERYVAIANALIEENITDDTEIANELHEWVGAPDSFFNWTASDQESAEIVQSVLQISPNADIAGDWQEQDDSQYAFYAAHAFVADVMIKIGRPPGPYHGDYIPPTA